MRDDIVFFSKCNKYKFIIKYSDNRSISLYKKKLFRYINISTIEIFTENDHKFPFPKPMGVSHNFSNLFSHKFTYRYIDNEKYIDSNMDKYLEIICDNAFEKNPIIVNNYKSIIREGRFSHILKSKINLK